MKQMLTNKSKHNSIWTSVAIGLLAAVILTILGAILGTTLINGGKIQETAYPVISAIILCISSFFGTLITTKKASQQLLIAAGTTVLGYLLLLAGIQILFFEGEFHSLWRGILLSVVGTIPTILISMKPHGHKKGKVKYRRV